MMISLHVTVVGVCVMRYSLLAIYFFLLSNWTHLDFCNPAFFFFSKGLN
jgi:hypothetical protein